MRYGISQSMHYPGEIRLGEPANENVNPFRKASTALTELYCLRRGILANTTSGYTFAQWADHQKTLRALERAIALCLDHL
jgi:hypothetical protein